jgi:hypothetical protein
MKKLGCAKCGGTKKMAKGGTTKSVSISKPGAGVVKETKGDTNQKMGIYGIAQTGPTGPNNSGIATMKKGGTKKEHPITTFRKANEARQTLVKTSMKKMQAGGSTVKKTLLPAPKPKTGMDALKALGKYVTTFGFAKEGYNPAPSKKASKPMVKPKKK